ncbi:MAG: MbnP family protein [Bacteroidota bacterium]
MKKIALFLALGLAFASCNNDDDGGTPPVVNTNVAFTFSQNWDGDPIENSDYETTVYTNANGEEMTLSKLVYLISDITFTNTTSGETFDAGDYNLIDARTGTGTTFTPGVEIPEGEYTVSFTYGFDDEDNQDGIYQDLNSSDGSWAVPPPLGGGYHYMRLEGKYINNVGAETAFQFHNIRANRHNTLPPGPGTLEELLDTSIDVDLGTVNIVSGTSIDIEMNVAEWFKNPNTWDLNVLFTILMPNWDAQILMNENGQNVFSRGVVAQPEGQ